MISNPTAAPTSWKINLPPGVSAKFIKIQEIQAPATSIQSAALSSLSAAIDSYAVQLVTVRLQKWQASR